jgi:hypothetical protein
MTGVLGYARTFFIGGPYRQEPLPTLADEEERFHTTLKDLGRHLEDGIPLLGTTPERLLQGPFADAMTHAGQLAMLRRLAGSPVPPENFLAAAINAANLGRAQPLPVSPNPEWPEAPPENRMDSEVAQLFQTYGLKVVMSDPEFPIKTYHGEISGEEANHKNVESYWPLLVSEWNLYPPALVEKTRLQRIILCEGLAFGNQARTAIPDYEFDDLYFDVGRGRYSELYVRKVIHHEFFHIIDYRDDGEVSTDIRWMALNPARFKYGPGGKSQQHDPSGSLLSEETPGFLTRYSTAAVEEDKAEVFAHMMVNVHAVEERAKKDGVIRAKIQQMSELLQIFCPQVDTQFWDRVGKVERKGIVQEVLV